MLQPVIGQWGGEETPERIHEVCEKYDLVHCSDPFKLEPVRTPDYSYSRLHGKPPGDEMYKYSYTEEDLDRLKEKLEGIEANENYVLWNNYNMYRDLKKYEEDSAK
ncbi:DUF72 domain-containing protein [Candidatus Bipolaricaulota bacterium]|nr:DUF72 domain-containing protein [Candidatus Bipolaricaulota bacterium]